MAVPGEDNFCCQIMDNDMMMGRIFNAPTRNTSANRFSAVPRSLIHKKLEKRVQWHCEGRKIGQENRNLDKHG